MGNGGDGSGSGRYEFSKSLEVNGIKPEMSSSIDNVQLPNLRANKWVKSCRLSVVNSIILSVFNDSNCAQESMHWEKGKMMNTQGCKYSRSILINGLEWGGVTFTLMHLKDVNY